MISSKSVVLPPNLVLESVCATHINSIIKKMMKIDFLYMDDITQYFPKLKDSMLRTRVIYLKLKILLEEFASGLLIGRNLFFKVGIGVISDFYLFWEISSEFSLLI